MYQAFSDAWWENKEPTALRPPLHSTRVSRLATRCIRPSFSNPDLHWIKAIHTPTNAIIAVACWMGPEHPLHNIWRADAADKYNWAEKFGWSVDDIKEMWSGCLMETWTSKFSKMDQTRAEVMGDEKHWYLAPLFTVPKFQGRGVGGKLLKWAFERADATSPVTPIYLEASAAGKPVYEHYGFNMCGEENMVRRGPKAAKTASEKNGNAEKGAVGLGVGQVREEVA